MRVFNNQLQLPWWGVLLGCAIAIFFTLPIGIIAMLVWEEKQTMGLNIITEYIIGYLYRGCPIANICFKVYGHISMSQAVTFLGTAWWLMDSVPNICNRDLIPPNSPWTCPGEHVFYDASVIWGLIGPRRIFGDLDTYSAVNWFFLVGALAPLLVWLTQKAFPNHKWIHLINFPILIGATRNMPPARVVNFTSWIIVAFISGFIVYRYQRVWWQRHNYVLSGALDVGLAFMGVLLYLCLGSENITLVWWGSNLRDNDCPLASCPTAKGIVVKGCPVF